MLTRINQYFTINELKNIVKKNSHDWNAALLLHANMLEIILSSKLSIYQALENPTRFAKSDLEQYYWILDFTHKSYIKENKRNAKILSAMYSKNPDIYLYQLEVTRRSFLLWKGTIAAGFSEKNFNEMRFIWSALSSCSKTLPHVCKQEIEIDRITGRDFCINLSTEKLIEIARHVPKCFR